MKTDHRPYTTPAITRAARIRKPPEATRANFKRSTVSSEATTRVSGVGSELRADAPDAPPPSTYFDSWEDFYNYAQQLHESGDQEQAQEYYYRAQLLYNAENQDVQQNATEGSGDEPTTLPSWQVYYNHAQQLYDAGDQQQAEAYYAHAQQLYDTYNEQLGHGAEGAGETAPESEHIDGIEPLPADDSDQQPYNASLEQTGCADSIYGVERESETNNYADGGIYEGAVEQQAREITQSTPHCDSLVAPPVQSSPAPDNEAVAGWAAHYAADLETDRPMFRPKRPLKRRIALWSAVSVMVLVGSFWGLFVLYLDQQGPSMSGDATADKSIFDTVYDATFQNMIDALEPTFDKTLQISAAAQPLLFELGLRRRQPVDYCRADDAPSKATEAGLISHRQKRDIPSRSAAPIPAKADESTPALSETSAESALETPKPDSPTVGSSTTEEPHETPVVEPPKAERRAERSDRRDRKERESASKRSAERRQKKARRERKSKKKARAKRRASRSKRRAVSQRKSSRRTDRLARNDRRSRSSSDSDRSRSKRRKALSDDPLAGLEY